MSCWLLEGMEESAVHISQEDCPAMFFSVPSIPTHDKDVPLAARTLSSIVSAVRNFHEAYKEIVRHSNGLKHGPPI